MAALATVGELESHLQRTDLDVPAAEQALQLALGAIQTYCGWNILETTETLQQEGSGTIVLTLPTLRMSALTEVRVDGTVLDLNEEWISWSKKGQLIRPRGWSKFRNYEIDCTHGFNPVPDVLKLVGLELAGRTLTAAVNNPQGLKRATVGQVTREWDSAGSGSAPKLSELDQRLLDLYKI